MSFPSPPFHLTNVFDSSYLPATPALPRFRNLCFLCFSFVLRFCPLHKPIFPLVLYFSLSLSLWLQYSNFTEPTVLCFCLVLIIIKYSEISNQRNFSKDLSADRQQRVEFPFFFNVLTIDWVTRHSRRSGISFYSNKELRMNRWVVPTRKSFVSQVGRNKSEQNGSL